MYDNQVNCLATKIEAIKCLSNNNSVLWKKVIPTLQTKRSNNKTIEIMEQNRLSIEKNKSKATIIEMLVEGSINCATIKNQQKIWNS